MECLFSNAKPKISVTRWSLPHSSGETLITQHLNQIKNLKYSPICTYYVQKNEPQPYLNKIVTTESLFMEINGCELKNDVLKSSHHDRNTA